MATITIYDSPSVTVWYHQDKRIVHHQVHKFVRGEEFRAFLLAGTEAMKANKAAKWLSDDRGSPVLAQEDLAWGHDVWFPQTAQAGWKYWAVVRPEKVLARVTMERLVKEYAAAGVTADFFEDPDEAMKWLEACS
jgi:hypothetical protein